MGLYDSYVILVVYGHRLIVITEKEILVYIYHFHNFFLIYFLSFPSYFVDYLTLQNFVGELHSGLKSQHFYCQISWL